MFYAVNVAENPFEIQGLENIFPFHKYPAASWG